MSVRPKRNSFEKGAYGNLRFQEAEHAWMDWAENIISTFETIITKAAKDLLGAEKELRDIKKMVQKSINISEFDGKFTKKEIEDLIKYLKNE